MDPQSPDTYEDGSDHGEQWDSDQKLHDGSGQTSPIGNDAGSHKASGPMQKRRRVTRACDECRRKKIKCDGKQPCTHCTVYSYECTYDQPSNRRRNPAPQYIESLEGRVHRAEALLHMIIPNLDLNDPAIDVAVAQGFIPGLTKPKLGTADEPRSLPPTAAVPADNSKDTDLESMVRAVGQLDMDENGHWDYHGHSSGLSFVRRMREQLGDIMGPDTRGTPFIKSRPQSHVIDSPKSASYESPMDNSISPSDLPPKEVARELCTNSVVEASSLLRSVHQPSFWASFERIYAMPPEHYADEDHKFLPLFYSTLALGSLFGKDERVEPNQPGYEGAIDQGFKYFRAARQMMDIADCRDLTSIQAVIFMILFLQSSARLSQCYAYIGVALRSALRMGLHRSFTDGFNPIEAETRKRVFWTIRKMDIYVGAMLGLPQTLSDEDIDQDYPVEIDDEYITKDALLPMPAGAVCLMSAFNAHTRLVLLLTKIVRKVYPIRLKNNQGNMEKAYTVPFSVIRDIENDLEIWKSSLPAYLSPSNQDPKFTRAQQLLRLAYAFSQVLLYRPFLHFVATDKRSRQVDQRAYTCAASYVNVSRNIIHLCTQMKQYGLLNGAFWFIMYTTFFSILSLVYFAAENPDNATAEAVMKDALEGKEVLRLMARRSMAADRCTATLDIIFSRLPDWLREGRQNPVMTRKRRQETDVPTPAQAARSHTDVGATVHDQVQSIAQRRANTFPKNSAALPTVKSSTLAAMGSKQSNVASGGPFKPTSSTFGPTSFPQMDTSSMNGALPQWNSTPEYGNPNLPDLSAMMFPSAEPFTYPNQPLTTFENSNQFGKQPSLFGNMGGFDSTAPMLSPGLMDDNLEAQFYALPPYIMQQQQQQQQHQQQWGSMGLTALNAAGKQQSVGSGTLSGGTGWRNPQHGGAQAQTSYSDINLNDIFGGGEWNSMLMDPGFRQ